MVYTLPLQPLGKITTTDETDPRYIARINEEVELKDGSRIRANVFLPRIGGPKWPVLMSSSPYGKDLPLLEAVGMEHRGTVIPPDQHCKHTRFEAPVPSWWCPKGYVLVYHDHRGASQSPGLLSMFSSQHYDDYAELVTWAADQPWSTGKVGLTGFSYLGLNQWFVAERQPRGLACIVPWEAMADLYRDATRHGGITNTKMNSFWFERSVLPVQYGKGQRHLLRRGPDSPEGNLTEEQLSENRHNFPEMVRQNQFIDDEPYQGCGASDLSKITVPVLSAGNWGGITLHLRGNIMAWMRCGSKHKYLRLHTGTHDRPYYNSPGIELQLSFFDCWLKGDDYGGWKTGQQAPVSFAIRKGSPGFGTADSEKTFEYRDEKEWPVARTVYQKLYLTTDKKLIKEKQTTESLLSYAGLNGDSLFFETSPANEEYEICGHPSVKLSMSLTNHAESQPAEIDVYLALRKFDAEGKEVFYTSSLGGPQAITVGWIRASHRVLNRKPYPEIREEFPWPTLSHRKEDIKPVWPGHIYDLLTELWPTNVVVEKGEKIILEVSPQDVAGSGPYTTEDPIYRSEERLGGKNNIHFGTQYENYLVLPIV